jgi:hypothetical protein
MSIWLVQRSVARRLGDASDLIRDLSPPSRLWQIDPTDAAHRLGLAKPASAAASAIAGALILTSA